MASSHSCPIAQSIQESLPKVRMIIPDLSIDPEIAFPQIDKILKEEEVDLIIGHSLGGFMAQKYRGYRKILINPSLGMSYMYFFRGDNRYKQPRHDGNNLWHVTTRMCKQYKEKEAVEFDNLTQEEDNLTKGCFGKWDLFTRYSAMRFKTHYSHCIMMPGGHYPTAQIIRKYIIPTIISSLQEVINPMEEEQIAPPRRMFTPDHLADIAEDHHRGGNGLPHTDLYSPGRDSHFSVDQHMHPEDNDWQDDHRHSRGGGGGMTPYDYR